jgi:hypothetical protein
MKIALIIVLIVVCLLVIRLRVHKFTVERFADSLNIKEYIDNKENTESLIKVCNVLRNIDKNTDSMLLLKKINNNTLERGDKEINTLLEEVKQLQGDIIKEHTAGKNYHRYRTNKEGEKQRDLLSMVKKQLETILPVNVNLV